MKKSLIKNKYSGQDSFEHGRKPGIGILVVNLGTPEEATPKAVRKYLAEFLSDTRVIEIPRMLWKLILHGIILRVRPARSANAYQRVWTEQGSPLMAASQALTDALSSELKSHIAGKYSIKLAMRYGNPSIEQGLKQLEAEGAERIMVLPLYPQYSGATIGSVADAVFKNLMTWRWVPELRLLGAYHDDPQYIIAVAESIRTHWRQKGQSDKLLMSFHGMPKATLIAGDPYFCHCHKTARLIAEELDLEEHQWEMAFQSRFGAAEWLQPYVSERLKKLPDEGVKNLTVICPGFAVDCLETLEEIAMEGHDDFIEAGGEQFEYIPALNDSAAQVAFMADRITEQCSGWPELKANKNQHEIHQQLDESKKLSLVAGA